MRRPIEVGGILIRHCVALLTRASSTRMGARLGAWFLVALRQYGDADAMLARALAAHPHDPALLTLHALSAHRTRRHAEAVDRWRRRLGVGRSVARPWWGVAINLRLLGRHEEATAVTREALLRFPNERRIIEEAAFAADHRFDFEEAARLWHRLLARRGAKPHWWQQYIGNLILLGRLDEAEALIARARRKYPDDVGLLVNTGLLAVGREDWKTAVAALSDYHARSPDDPASRDLLGRALQMRNLAAAVDAPSPIAPAPIDVGRVEDDSTRSLLLGFESLGRDCEFGLLQRRYGAEPLGLLRWNGTSMPGLLLGLACRFDGLGDPAHLQLRVLPHSRHYCVCDPRLDFEMHTFMFESQVDADALLRKMHKTVRYLKDKFLADLETAHKVFVYADPQCEQSLALTLHAALRRFGPARLLWVMPVDAVSAAGFADRRPGEIREIDEGLFVGFLSRPGAGSDGVWDIAFDEWVAICTRMAIPRAEHPIADGSSGTAGS